MGVIFVNFRQEIHKTGGEEGSSEFAFVGGYLSLFQQPSIPILLGVQLWCKVAQRGGGVASRSLDGGGKCGFHLNGRGGRRDNSLKRRYRRIKGSFFLSFLARGRHWKCGFWTSFSVKEGVKPEKRGFQPMRKKLGGKFGVVFSFAVVVTDTDLFNCAPIPSLRH